EAVEAVALLEAGWEQLRGRAGPAREEGPDAPGIMPEVLVLLSGHGQDDLLGPARRLRRGGGSFTMDGPGVRSGGHLRIPFPGKKKDAKKAAGRIPGTTSNTCNSLGSAFSPPRPRGRLVSLPATGHRPPATRPLIRIGDEICATGRRGLHGCWEQSLVGAQISLLVRIRRGPGVGSARPRPRR